MRGRFYIALPTLTQKPAAMSCRYTLANAALNKEQRMSSDGLAEFVSKLYLNRHQQHNPPEFDEQIDTFLESYKVILSQQGTVHHDLS